MMIDISEEYAHDVIITKLQEDFEMISDDIKIIEAMNRAGETEIDLRKFYEVRDSIKNVLRYHMEEDFFEEWLELENEQINETTRS